MTTSKLSDQLHRSWEANANAWLTSVRHTLIESRRLATDRAIVEAVLALAPAHVLDAGCGEGWLCRALAASGVSAVGVDGSAVLVHAACTADPSSRYLRLRFEEFRRLPEVVGGGFDVAVFNFSLFDEDSRSVIASVREVLRPGGVIVIQTLHPSPGNDEHEPTDGWRTETFDCVDEPFPASMPWYFRTRESWLQVVQEAGLTIDSVREPRHPKTGAPLSLLIVATEPAV